MPANTVELYPINENLKEKYRREPTLGALSKNLGPLSTKGSTRLYWNRALLELDGLEKLPPALKGFLLYKFEHDDSGMLEKLQVALESQDDSTDFADVMDPGMDWVYLFCNLFNTVAPIVATVIKPLVMWIPIVGVLWNLFDTLGAVALAAHEGKQGDDWAKNVNYGSAIQLGACTSVTITSLFMPSVSALGIAGTAAGGFGFAAAMAIAWGLEERAVKLCDKRIEYLVKEEIDDDTVTQKYKVWRDAIDDNDGTEEEAQSDLNNSLDELEKELTIQGNKPEKLLATKMCRKQVKEREMHSRMRSVWKWCTVAMTVVATVAVVAVAVGVSVATCGVATAVAGSALAAGTGIYRLHQKHKLAKAEQSDGRDQKTRELEDIKKFVASKDYYDYEKTHDGGNSERVKLYKTLYDRGLFDRYASDVYDIETEFKGERATPEVDESKFQELNQYLDELSPIKKNKPRQFKDLLPSIIELFLQGKGKGEWDQLKENYIKYFPYGEDVFKAGSKNKRFANAKISPYVEESINHYLDEYAIKLAYKPKLTAQQKIAMYEGRKQALTRLAEKIQAAYSRRKDKNSDTMSYGEIDSVVEHHRQQVSREPPKVMMDTFHAHLTGSHDEIEFAL
ncbi:hypothetical protein [Piscirickettsia litoralis]|uniref:Uncharacterized protein n=1 Tax=Piscirickettsia litoralis TaxID=1891921 RepID=A0ABX3A8I2_9GAMM|nr:hypothetical protein [Piscirickettsia litoralis]ODN42434.1 hypothetical protein BGC07_05155 [Piscirickettsia litoralis]